MIVGALLGGVIGVVALTDDRRRQHERLLRDAVRLSGMSMDRASREAEVDQAQFTRQLAMLEGTHKRLAMLPDRFWQWYAVTIVDTFGLPREAQRAARLAVATIALKRMARAALPPARKERAS